MTHGIARHINSILHVSISAVLLWCLLLTGEDLYRRNKTAEAAGMINLDLIADLNTHCPHARPHDLADFLITGSTITYRCPVLSLWWPEYFSSHMILDSLMQFASPSIQHS